LDPSSPPVNSTDAGAPAVFIEPSALVFVNVQFAGSKAPENWADNRGRQKNSPNSRAKNVVLKKVDCKKKFLQWVMEDFIVQCFI
jgi:hypothetical protein